MTDVAVGSERAVGIGPTCPVWTLPPLMALGLTLRSGSGYAVRGVSITVRAGEMALLVGPTGAGQRACMEMISGRASPTFGTVTVCGRPIKPGMSSLAVNAAPAPDAGLTGRQWLERRVRRDVSTVEEADTRVHQTVERMKLTGLADEPIGTLDRSGIRLLSVAGALAPQAPVVVLDEPVAELDDDDEEAVLGATTAAREKGSAVLVSATCGRIPRAPFDRVFVLLGGALRYAGTGQSATAWARSRYGETVSPRVLRGADRAVR